MIKWTKKTYARELKKGYWDLEPHFHYYSFLEFLGLFSLFEKENMNINDVKSALYGKFVCEGKSIRKGFYADMNFMSEVLRKIVKKHTEVKK